jgi:hypothetical protein
MMTWDEIRAAYPPDTLLVLEAVEVEWDRVFRYYEPVRVLEVIPANEDPVTYVEKYCAVMSRERVVAISTAAPILKTQSFFTGLIRLVDDVPDVGWPPPIVVDLRAPRGQRQASGRRGHGSGG